MSQVDHQSIDDKIAKLLIKQAVDRVQPVEGEFVSQIFLVPKKDGSQRMWST